MRLAWTTAEKNLLRTRPQRAKWYLAVHRPETVYSTQLASAAGHWPTISLVLSQDAPVGSVGDTASHMTVFIGTTAGASDKGRVRLRDVITATNAKIAESGCGLINFQAGDHFTVKKLYEPWIMHMRYSTGFNAWRMDYSRAYTDQFTNFIPNIIMGPPAAAIQDGAGNATINYVGTSTQYIDTSFTSASWVFPDGGTTLNIGSEHDPASRNYTTSLSDGRYHSLMVTAANGKADTSQRLTWVFDDESQLPEVEFATITGGLETGGYNATFAIRNQDGTIVKIPHRSEIVIFEEASYGANYSEVGGNYPFRSNIVFRGWVQDETVVINPFSGQTTFGAATLHEALQKTQSGDVFHFESYGDEWVEFPNVTLDKVTMDIINYRSTISEITDTCLLSATFTMEGGDGFMFAQDLPRGSVWQQLTTNYTDKGIMGYFSSDMQGNLYPTADAQITGGSAALPVSMHIRDEDKRDQVQIATKQYETRSLIRLLSVASAAPDSAVKFGAEAPGQTPGYFGTEHEISRGLVADNQDTLIIWSGNLLAKENMKYPKTTVPLAPYARLDSVPQSRITMSLSGVNNPRGIEWSNKEFFPTNTNIQYNSVAGIPQVTVDLEEVVDGVSGSAFTFAVPTPVDIPGPPPPPPPLPPVEIPITPGDGFGTNYAVGHSKVCRTRDLSVSSPTWTDISGTISGTNYDFILDPWEPDKTGYFLSSTGVWKATGLQNSGAPTWTHVLQSSDIPLGANDTFADFEYKIQGSINVKDYIVCFARLDTTSGSGGEIAVCCYTEDGGSSWTFVNFITATGFPQGGVQVGAGFDVVPHLVGGDIRIYVNLYLDTGTGNLYRIMRSTNRGATWATVQDLEYSGDPDGGTVMNTPYNGNSDGLIGWCSYNVDSGSTKQIYKTTDGWATYTQFTLTGAGSNASESWAKRLGIEVYVQDNNRVAIWNSEGRFYLATDGSTFSEVSKTGYVFATHGGVSGAGGFPTVNTQYYIITVEHYVFVSIDGGSTWISKTGNLRSLMTVDESTAEPPLKQVIVPLWIEA